MAKTSGQMHLELALSPTGHVYLDAGVHVQEILDASTTEKIKHLFVHDACYGLLHLGVEAFDDVLPPSFSFWRSFAHRFVTETCKFHSVTDQKIEFVPPCLPQTFDDIMKGAPFFKGIEYLNFTICEQLWNALSLCLKAEMTKAGEDLETYLCRYNSFWNQIGRICFHLAENKGNENYPFAFLATYTSHCDQDFKLQHMPLNRALQEYAQGKNNPALLKLLIPIQRAATENSFIKELLDSNDIFNPLLWTAYQAHKFLQGIATFEASGIVVRVPNWWNPKAPSRPKVSVTIGEQQAKLGFDALIDFNLCISLDGVANLTEAELQELFISQENFIKVKGRWVEVDREKLQQVLSHWKKIQHQIKNNGLSFSQGVRLFAGIRPENHDTVQDEVAINEWSEVVAGEWLKKTLHDLRNPVELGANNHATILEKHLRAVLRPYQTTGVHWLWLLYRLKLGGCLADDMGLGKTIQIIALMVLIKFTRCIHMPHLLVVPASLLGNWQNEFAHFAPDLNIFVAHNSVNNLEYISIEKVQTFDVIVTTYSALLRIPWIASLQWDLLVLDEAQMIKNPGTKQTRAVKSLHSKVRFSLTGTPIENFLTDLWSLFDFTSSGLLGSLHDFNKYKKNYLHNDDSSAKARFFSALRTLVSPYILRRLKSDKRIIQDLPDKTEVLAYCALSKQQVLLYQQAVNEMRELLEMAKAGIQRQGLILSFILRFKQICNHPDQWLGYGNYADKESGKFLRLQEICEEIAAKQEKVLVFTQFREVIDPLSQFLARIFGREGLTLHGETPVGKRSQLVASFQEEQGPPFFVLSLKAGGTGLNLTNASHVIHFDRWWNPAVENQATDRAYRIGQKKNILVHKFICKGTIEEKINDLITSKQALSQEILSESDNVAFTELSNEELIKIVSLDLHHILME
jgi:hypothetical protein